MHTNLEASESLVVGDRAVLVGDGAHVRVLGKVELAVGILAANEETASFAQLSTEGFSPDSVALVEDEVEGL